ncbi:hypothetical protein V7266_30595 [Neobacillus drentensis]|uniref:hypothetical protein n=1 Tax=Neobacillus drentensis TaxID=220684 RepID=UPI002FFFE896
MVNYVIASLFVIIIGCLFILFGYFILNYGDQYSYQAAPICWIIGLLLIPIGVLTIFNPAILKDLLHSLALLLHNLTQ